MPHVITERPNLSAKIPTLHPQRLNRDGHKPGPARVSAGNRGFAPTAYLWDDYRDSGGCAMPTVRFTSTLVRHRPAPAFDAPGQTVRAVLAAGLVDDPLLKSYVLDDQGRVRKHINIFVEGAMVRDRLRLSDPVGGQSEIYVLQALSGG